VPARLAVRHPTHPNAPVIADQERRTGATRGRGAWCQTGTPGLRFTWVQNARRSFGARLIRVNADGLWVVAQRVPGGDAPTGRLFWVEPIQPPGGAPFDVVVRVVQACAGPHRDAVRLDCRFCPGEDPRVHRTQRARLERLLAVNQRGNRPRRVERRSRR